MADWPANGETDWNTKMLAYLAVEHSTDGTHNGTGMVRQVVTTTSGAVATGTTTIPLNDTIPQQSTEGTNIAALDTIITPKSATNILVIKAVCEMAHSVAAKSVLMCLFQDATENALAVAGSLNPAAGFWTSVPLTFSMVAGTTSATTFKISIGSDAGGTVTLNGFGSARKMGGTLISSLSIMEVQV